MTFVSLWNKFDIKNLVKLSLSWDCHMICIYTGKVPVHVCIWFVPHGYIHSCQSKSCASVPHQKDTAVTVICDVSGGNVPGGWPASQKTGLQSRWEVTAGFCIKYEFDHIYFFFLLKGSVSRILRCVLLYINWKLSLRTIIDLHKILGLLQGQFTIYVRVQKQAGTPLYSDIVSSRQYW